MSLINRHDFRRDGDGPRFTGSIALGATTFTGCVATWRGDIERAWDNAERIFAFVTHRFEEIEARIKADLAPDLRGWVEGPHSSNDLAAAVVAAMRVTDRVEFTIYDAGASSLYFKGPDFVQGHSIEVQFDETGKLTGVGLAG